MTAVALTPVPDDSAFDPWCAVAGADAGLAPSPDAGIAPSSAADGCATVSAPASPASAAAPRAADELDELGARIVGLSARVAAATCRWLLLVAEFDRREGYARWGLGSTAQWLTHACGIAHRTAVEHVRVARALSAFPALTAALQAGRISYSHARAISRLARPGERRLVDDLLQVAEHGSVGQLESVVRGLRTVEDNTFADPAAVAGDRGASAAGQGGGEYLRHGWASRTSHWQLSTRLDPERGALIEGALTQLAAAEALSSTDALVRIAEIALAALHRRPEGPPRGLRGHEQAAVVIHLDAAALTAGPTRAPATDTRHADPATATATATATDTNTKTETETVEPPSADAGAGGTAHTAPRSRERGTGPDPDANPNPNPTPTPTPTPEHDPDRPLERPFGRIADGPGLPRRVIERLLCACRIRVAVLDGDPTALNRTVLDLGRTKRLVDDRMFYALLIRDRHCTHPGCTSKHKLQAHHVIHWLHGGRTDMANLVLLCERHHHAHHDGEFTVHRIGSRRHGTFQFHRPDGSVLPRHIDPSRHLDPDAPPIETEHADILDSTMLSKSVGDRLDHAWAVAVLADRRQGGRSPAAA